MHRKPRNWRFTAMVSAAVVVLAVMAGAAAKASASFSNPDHSFAPPVLASQALKAVDRMPDRPHLKFVAVASFSGPQSVRVKPGQTLSSIAADVLGSPRRWPILWWDNQSKIPNPNALRSDIRLHFGTWRHVRPWLSRRAMRAIPKPAPVQVASTTSTAQPVASAPATDAATYSGAPGSFQACVIARESGGNPSAVNPSSGAGGLYQFLPSTWAALGFPGLPEYASVAMQNAAFEKAYAESGTSPWAPYDGC
jgi:hypothetical protein